MSLTSFKHCAGTFKTPSPTQALLFMLPPLLALQEQFFYYHAFRYCVDFSFKAFFAACLNRCHNLDANYSAQNPSDVSYGAFI